MWYNKPMYDTREKQLRKVAYNTFERLGIPHIPINIEYLDKPCHKRAMFNMKDMDITTYIFNNELIVEQAYIDIQLPNASNWEKALFCLFHEIAHYFHYTKYRTHYDKLWAVYIPTSTNKMEMIANKLAHILLKRLDK